MALSWNEIKERAVKFSKEWEDTQNEEADAKPFLVEFFNVFGINSKKFATFEHRVKKLDERDGYIDLLWKGTILIEMKSRGKNLDKAFQQAKDYLHGLKQHELPKYILVCDFENFKLHDLEEEIVVEFKLKDLVNNVQNFAYLLGYPKKVHVAQDPANIKAAELMGKLHDRLKEIGYDGHPLEVYLVRLLFCLFAEDTTIFNKEQFQDYIANRTNEDGSDLAPKLQELFQVLDTPNNKRFKNLDEDLMAFPYVNGKLFQEILPMASFDSKMRLALLECCYIDWSKISPAIFGSMFQSVMNPKERRNLGAHYTSETNILKLIKPLFLDELWAEFEKFKYSDTKLTHLHNKIAALKFFDPACGCGNFLIITYREIRLLELQILLELQKLNLRIHQMEFLDISLFFKVNVDQFYGIEYEEFPSRIAEVAMWLIDHQMNMLASIETGERLFRIPLIKSANIVHGNALQVDWNNLEKSKTYDINANVTNIFTLNEPNETYEVLNIYSKKVNINPTHATQAQQNGKCEYDYIIGNPPFIGKSVKSEEQKLDLERLFSGIKGTGVLDYVCGWYLKAAQLIQNTKTKCAFVSTNSIVQGEQVGILWNLLFSHYKIKIHFAHRTFDWSNEASKNAAVHCVIVGFASFDIPYKRLFDYEDIKGEPFEMVVKNINPYLVDAKDVFIEKRRKPISNVPEIAFGSMPNDGGFLIMTENEKIEFLKKEPNAEKYIKPLLSAKEFLNNEKRWCFWLKDINPSDLKSLPETSKRVQSVKEYRNKSTREATKKLANFPTLFGEDRQPKTDFILIPRHSSENRKYISMGFFKSNAIASDSCLFIANGSLFHFGVLMSAMHMAWVKTICGRLESRFRYSNEIVYNNFPWPENPTEKQMASIEEKAQKVLDVQLSFQDPSPSGRSGGTSLANLYENKYMPPALVKAHNDLDKAVDLAYRSVAFTTEANRMAYLFELYEKYTADLFTVEKPKKKK